MAQPKDADKMLTFPDSRQCSPDMCGVAATQVVLYYYGVAIIQSKLAEIMGLDPEIGIEPEQIVKTFEDRDFEVDFCKMTIEDVKLYLDKDIPVILLIQAWAADYPVDYTGIDEEGHYVVAMGYDDENKRFLFDDPSFLDNRGYIGYDELLTRWRMYASDGEHILENHGIAVYGKKPLFNPKKLMHIDGSMLSKRYLQSNGGLRKVPWVQGSSFDSSKPQKDSKPSLRVTYRWLRLKGLT